MAKTALALSVFFFLGSIAWYIFPFFTQVTIDGPSSFASPIPPLLEKTFYSIKRQNDYWKPAMQQAYASNELSLSASSALSYDLTTGKFLYQKNIDKRLPIASLTKIMTAIVALENENVGQKILIGSKAAQVGEDSMGLSAGERLTVQELLDGLFLNSGNDAAEALAAGSQFGRNNFVYLMNKKAEDLGLANTRFTNPTGLEGDGSQYSTALDLLVMTRYGLQNKVFADTAAKIESSILQEDSHKAFNLYNETNLLTSYPGVKGVKTGFTNEAGMCLVTYLEYGGHKIIAVILNSQNRRQEMKDLLDYSLGSLGVTPPKHG